MRYRNMINCALGAIARSTWPIILAAMYIALALLVLGCNSTSETKTGTLSGNIELLNDTDDPQLDPVDFSGVTIALYNLAELDTTIVRINQEYPLIGVVINQETEFDHRLQVPIMVTTTSTDGSFTLSSIETGQYNLAVFKVGWGYRYIYNVSIAEGANSISNYVGAVSAAHRGRNTDVIHLYPETVFNSAIQDDVSLLPDHVYRVASNSILFGACNVYDNPVIMIDPGVRLDVYGALQLNPSNAYWRVTSSDYIYATTAVDSIDSFDKLSFLNPDNNLVISGLILEYSSNGLRSLNNNVDVSRSIFRYCDASALVLESTSVAFYKMLIRDNFYKGLTISCPATINNSLFARNWESCMLFESLAEVSNCYFYGGIKALRPFIENSTIQYCCFDKNDTAIAPCASSPIIKWNNFYNNERDVEMNHYGISGSYMYCNPIITLNNFYGNKFYIHLMGSSSLQGGWAANLGVSSDQVYPNNYMISEDLTYRIFDENYPNSNVPYTASMIPRRNSPVSPAGIQ